MIAGVAESSDKNGSGKLTQALGFQEWGEYGNRDLSNKVIYLCILQDESLIDFSTDVFGIGESVEWGSRNIVLQLMAGDTVNVVQEITGTSSASNLSFCVALIKA